MIKYKNHKEKVEFLMNIKIMLVKFQKFKYMKILIIKKMNI